MWRSEDSVWEFSLASLRTLGLNSGHKACMQALLSTKPSYSTLNQEFLEQNLSRRKNLGYKITEIMCGETMPNSASITWKIGKHKEQVS